MTLFAISPELTRWSLTIGFVFVAILAAYLMRRAWIGKSIQMENLPGLPSAPEVSQTGKRFQGRYLTTTLADQWLERVTAHGLGAPSRAELVIDETGISVLRTGAPSFQIPLNELQSVRTDRAIGGKAYEADGILVITWQHGDVALDTGFRASIATEHLEILEQTESAVRR